MESTDNPIRQAILLEIQKQGKKMSVQEVRQTYADRFIKMGDRIVEEVTTVTIGIGKTKRPMKMIPGLPKGKKVLTPTGTGFPTVRPTHGSASSLTVFPAPGLR